MKNQFLLFSVLIALMSGCAKTTFEQQALNDPTDLNSLFKESENPFYGVPDSMSVVNISVSAIKYNPLSQAYLVPERATIVIWPNENGNLEIKEVDKAIQGLAFDRINHTLVSTQNIANTNSISLQDLLPGKYLIAVILNDQIEMGKKAYSTKEITLEKFGKLNLHKIFSPQIKNGEFEAWNLK